MKSLYFRNFIMMAGMVLLSFLILGVSFVFLARGFIFSEKRQNLSRTAEETSKLVKAKFANGTVTLDTNFQMTLSAISNATGDHVFMSDYQGVVRYCSDAYYCTKHVGRQVNEQIMETLRDSGGFNIQTELNGFYNKTHYVAASAIELPGYEKPALYVFASSDITTMMRAWQTFMSLFFGSATVILVIALIFSFITSKQQARPINKIAAAARSFAHGDYSVRVNEEESRIDEIGELASAFNAMARSIERADERRGEFIANISHELKTPMTTISGFTDGLLDGTIPKENQEKYLLTISDETKRLSRLVRRMLEHSRIRFAEEDSLQKHVFDISEVMRRTLIYFEKKITDRGLDVDAMLPEACIYVLGDKDAITQVVYNLLENAIKFAEEGSTIYLSLWKQGAKAYVSVKNKGDVIPAEELPLIFDRFHKTDRSRSRDREGVGLGLYIVKSILGNHNEDITVTSENGETEFVFTITLGSLKPSK